MVEKILNKWCDDLEEILQCPVCMHPPKPNKPIFQCTEGHTICETCKYRIPQCPICTHDWSPVRNRLAESMSTKLEDIKKSLVDPLTEIHKLSTPTNSVSVQCQADMLQPISNRQHGPYPCCVDGCEVMKHYQQLINHIKEDHAAVLFIELAYTDEIFQHTWSITSLQSDTKMDYAMQITNLGLFFIKISTDAYSNFKGTVVMAHNAQTAKLFSYQLEILDCRDSCVYFGEVMSCRNIQESLLPGKCLEVTSEDIQEIRQSELITFALLLTRNTNAAEVEQTINNKKSKKKNWRKGKNAGQRNEVYVQYTL